MTDGEALEIYRHAEKYPILERMQGKEVRYSSGTELKFCPYCGRELKGEERWSAKSAGKRSTV